MKNRSISKVPPVVDVHGAFLRRTDLSGANLQNANLSHADFTGAVFRRANFQGARMVGTKLQGADLTNARNLTVEQLSGAIIDEQTQLPSYIDLNKLQNASTTAHEAARV